LETESCRVNGCGRPAKEPIGFIWDRKFQKYGNYDGTSGKVRPHFDHFSRLDKAEISIELFL
jgi:hypothetical protein